MTFPRSKPSLWWTRSRRSFTATAAPRLRTPISRISLRWKLLRRCLSRRWNRGSIGCLGERSLFIRCLAVANVISSLSLSNFTLLDLLYMYSCMYSGWVCVCYLLLLKWSDLSFAKQLIFLGFYMLPVLGLKCCYCWLTKLSSDGNSIESGMYL